MELSAEDKHKYYCSLADTETEQYYIAVDLLDPIEGKEGVGGRAAISTKMGYCPLYLEIQAITLAIIQRQKELPSTFARLQIHYKEHDHL